MRLQGAQPKDTIKKETKSDMKRITCTPLPSYLQDITHFFGLLFAVHLFV